MKDKNLKPEFTVIRQNQANAKFFVASGSEFGGSNPPTAGAPANSATQYSYTSGTNDIPM